MNEINYKAFFEQSPILQLVLNRDFTIVKASEFFLSTTNKLFENIDGKNIFEVFPKNHIDDENDNKLLESLNKVVRSKLADKITIARYDIAGSGNATEQWAITNSPVLDEAKNVQFIVHKIDDITEILQARKKIEETDIFNRSFLENSPDCIKIIDKDGRIEFINNNGLCLLEINDFKEAKNKYWWDLWADDDKPMIQQVITSALRKDKVRFQASSNTAKGNNKWWDIIIMPLRVDKETNEAEKLLTVSRDITEFKKASLKLEESEKHFRQLAHMIPSKISSATADGQILYLNEKWLEYTGKTFKELAGLRYFEILHPDEVDLCKNKFLKAAETGTTLNMEMRFLNKEGEYKWHLNFATPIKDSYGKITTWVGNTIEIHEQVKQKELLEKAVRERTLELEIANKELIYQNLEKEKRSAELGIANIELAFQNSEKEKRSAELLLVNKELQSFTFVASHDLQEPLRKITFFAERIIESELQNLTHTGKDYFRRMQSAAVRMRQLIEDLLSFSRVNIIDREMVVTDLKTIILEVEEELKESIENKHIIIDIHCSCQIKVIVFQFRQLMHNLLGNSIKFAQPDIIPNITINSHISYGKELNNNELIPEDKYCHISLRDNGIGFESEYSKRIFEVFQKLHSKELYKGTGIGLAIVKKIVENHNGIITATSILGEGATFNIYLPV